MGKLLSLLLVTFLLAGCSSAGPTPTPTSPTPVVTRTPVKRDLIDPILKLERPLESDLVIEQTRLTGDLLREGLYAEVEALMNDLYQSKATAPSGTPRLFYLLDRLSRPDLLEPLRTWQKEAPQSVWAHISFGLASHRASRKVRGRRSASDLSQQDTDKIWALSKAGRDSLAEAGKLQQANVYVPWAELALLSGTAAEASEIKDALTRAITLEPGFFPAYQEAAQYYGKKDEEGLRPLLSGLDNLLLARVDADNWRNLDWPRSEVGFQDLRKQYPKSTLILNQYARAAVANHAPNAKALLTEVGDRYEPLAWRGFSSFERARETVLGVTTEAQSSSEPINKLIPIEIAPPGYWQDEVQVTARLKKARGRLATIKTRLAETPAVSPETEKLETELSVLKAEQNGLRDQLFKKEGAIW